MVARLDVIEIKLNEVLKKFGAEDEDLWDLGEHIFNRSIKRLEERNEDSKETLDQPELF